MCKRNSWSLLYQHRKRAAQRFGSVFDLPLQRHVRTIVVAALGDASTVLEIGAGDRRYREHLRRAHPRVEYRSCDIDPQQAHDYRSLDEIHETFDGVFALEVIEHLPVEAIGPWLDAIRRCLTPGGCLVLSTPNTFYPPAFLRDATHRTPLCYDELAGLVSAAGLSVERLMRVHHGPLWRRWTQRFLFGWLFRLIGIDFAHQIVLVARQPTPSEATDGPAHS